MGVDEMGVDEMGSRQSGTTPFASYASHSSRDRPSHNYYVTSAEEIRCV